MSSVIKHKIVWTSVQQWACWVTTFQRAMMILFEAFCFPALLNINNIDFFHNLLFIISYNVLWSYPLLLLTVFCLMPTPVDFSLLKLIPSQFNVLNWCYLLPQVAQLSCAYDFHTYIISGRHCSVASSHTQNSTSFCLEIFILVVMV